MSPVASQTGTSKDSGPGGKDIRSFFGGTGGSSSMSAKQRNAQPNPAKHSLSSPKAPRPAIQILESTSIEIDGDNKPQTKVRNASAKRKAVLISSDEDEGELKITPPKKKSALPRKGHVSVKSGVISSDGEEDEPKKKSATVRSPTKKGLDHKAPGKPRVSASKGRKHKTDDDDFEDEMSDEDNDFIVSEKAKPVKAKSGSTKVKTSIRKVDGDDTKDTKKSEAANAPKQKPNWIAKKAARSAGPAAPGSKPIPDGAPNCLAGLSFVFTGELSSLSRDEAVDLAKRYGGRVVLQPSSKTSYVVVGDNAGPSKLAAIDKHKLRKINEDEFLDLIATRSSDDADDKTKTKLAKEEAEMRRAAEEMARAERKAEKERAKAIMSAASGGGTARVKPPVDMRSQLWTVRYAPKMLKEICGNKGQVEKLQLWLQDWSSSLKSSFKKPGKNGMNIFRAVLITGPPGIGKTTSAHLCAKLAGFTPIELNASDARSKKLVENSTNIANTSLDGWMSGKRTTPKTVNATGIEISDKSCLIMDEVDGMSAGDRGGVGALNSLIKKTKIPIICIANDRNAQKLKPLLNTTFNLSFRKPDAAAVRSRIMTIAFKEKMKIPANVVDQLVQGAQSDIRQVLNMLSTWKLSSSSMDFDEGKNLAKINEKYTIMTPFNVTSKMLGPYLFSSTARETLGDKMELYFHDHAFVPLFIQENYLKTEPARLRAHDGREKGLQHLRLMDKAASSISDSDLVDSLIHGPEQHWALMPLHAVISTVRPASFLYGTGSGYGGPNAMSFPQWLGQNSKRGKLTRQLGDVQIRMRLKVSGDKPEIRQHYIPSLFPRLVKPLIDVGTSAVDEIIETMDDYYLSKEDWDTIIELGVDTHKDEFVLKKISTSTKTALTRKYNSTDHPVPFHKAQEFGKAPKKLATEPAPDLEEAFDLDEGVDEEPESKDEDEDISKDSLIKTGRKGKGKAKVTGKSKK
ncbi:DNA replication factor C, large subunit [Fomitiporia mediterranea MF3/22]|uniref:DNA replication factor C, large subunit n=1 Tax=Fomitiporia mediterranea (strain MF3/22) TaxID=694068 RepID=UPI0004407ADC|nr:DNA replication factor C, large subunit [Fomitiporia mediterranea MF3/22]EJD00743.1 DNA replication factor C, large subunit [Fomitiporia mediterranea MF3/22]